MKEEINWKELIIGILLMVIVYLMISNNYYKSKVENFSKDTIYVLVDSVGNESILVEWNYR